MKRIIAIAVLLIFHASAWAQAPSTQVPTPFDRFIASPAVTWAAYINDTVRFHDFNLTKLLIEKFSAGKIRASMPVGFGSDDARRLKYCSKRYLDRQKFGSMVDTIPSNDDLYPAKAGYLTENRYAPSLDTSKSLLTDITQVLYVENGQLKSYIPWIAPMYPIFTSTGVYLGEADYFSTCFNYQRNLQAGKKATLIFLGSSETKISPDSINPQFKLKELYGRNLLATLWPYLQKGNYPLTDLVKKSPLKPSQLNSHLFNDEAVMVPKYDSLGYVIGEEEIVDPISAASFSHATIRYEWYYDKRLNIVFSRIKEMQLLGLKYKADKTAYGPIAILGISF